MNSNSPVATGAAAVVGGNLGDVVVYFAQIAHLPLPSVSVAATIGAIILASAHLLANYLVARSARASAPADLPKASAPTGASA
jgi:hypothetical protein